MATVFERLESFLRTAGIDFAVSHHAPVYTSEEAAAIRGVPLKSGAKALVLKAGDQFVMVVLPADQKLDSKRIKQHLRVKSIRFATREEVMHWTGLEPGSIPPFGSLFQLQTYLEPSLGENESINFNAGDHAISIQMKFTDYLRAEQPISIG